MSWTHQSAEGLEAAVEMAELKVAFKLEEVYARVTFRPAPRLVEGDNA